jgi:hypothetical protein
MNEPAVERIESELAKLRPARPPEEFMARLAAAAPADSVRQQTNNLHSAQIRSASSWRWAWQWLAPATVVLMAAAYAAWWPWRTGPDGSSPEAVSPAAFVKNGRSPDDIVIDRRVVAAYDAVAVLPGGEPVRFRCREWIDQVIFSDPARGLEIERSTPHLEVVPVSFESY